MGEKCPKITLVSIINHTRRAIHCRYRHFNRLQQRHWKSKREYPWAWDWKSSCNQCNYPAWIDVRMWKQARFQIEKLHPLITLFGYNNRLQPVSDPCFCQIHCWRVCLPAHGPDPVRPLGARVKKWRCIVTSYISKTFSLHPPLYSFLYRSDKIQQNKFCGVRKYANFVSCALLNSIGQNLGKFP